MRLIPAVLQMRAEYRREAREDIASIKAAPVGEGLESRQDCLP